MSRSFAQGKFSPAGWIVAIAALATIGVAGSVGLRTQKSASAHPAAPLAPLSAEQSSRVRANLSALPLAFEANHGQTDPQVKYMARGNGYTVFLTKNETVFSLQQSTGAAEPVTKNRAGRELAEQKNVTSAAIHLGLVGANAQPQMAAVDKLPGVSNYFIGNDPNKWHAGVEQFARVSYKDVYPGVNLAFYGAQKQLEFDFIVAPGASVTPIRMGVSGAQSISTDDAGNLMLMSSAGNVLLHKPVAYQQKDGGRQPVDATFVLEANNQVGLKLGQYDASRELVIDPSVSYATYLGGATEDEVFGIAVDPSNNVYATGQSNSTSLFPGGNVPAGNGYDAFVTKLTSAGALSYTTFVGGTSTDSSLAIAVDASGSAYITGITESPDFPVTTGAAQTTQTGLGTNCTNQNVTGAACSDAYAAKLNASGVVTWATFIGGQNDDHGYGIALDSSGNVWVAGDTFSSSFYPVLHATTVFTSSFNNGVVSTLPYDDGFVVEINPSGSGFLYATYLGGALDDQINGLAIDGSNNVYVAGSTFSSDFPFTSGAYQTKCGSDGNCNLNAGNYYSDGFVTKLAGPGYTTAGGYSTFIGGSSDDAAFAIAVDGSGDAYITGQTTNDDTTTTPAVPYPTTNGAFSTTYNASARSNGFVTELNPAGSSLVYSTFLGGSTQDSGGGIVVDQFANAYVTGSTLSTDFPTTSNAFQTKLNGNGTAGNSDAFVTEVSSGGASLGFSSYLGGSGDEDASISGSFGTIALDASRNMWVGGSTNSSTDFPATTGAAQTTYGGGTYDGFVAEISTATAPDFNIAATALSPSSVAPGSSATSTVTVTALNGYAGTVNLTCAVTGGGTPAPTCSLSPTSGASSTLTVNTTGTAAAMHRTPSVFYAMWLPIVGLSLIGMRFSSGNSRRRKLLGFLLLGLVMMALFFLPACGGSSNNGGGGGGGCSGCTPAGSYTISVTGTDSVNSNLTHSVNPALTLTVN